MSDGQKSVAAWNNWLAANESTADPTTIKPVPEYRSYLENRLQSAFYAGVQAGIAVAEERMIEQFRKLMKGQP